MKVAIGQTGAMRQQIAERDRARRLVCLIEWTLWIAQHAQARQFGCALRDWLVEIETPFVEKRQRAHGRDWLRHRGDAEDRVAFNRRPGHKVAAPDGYDVTSRSVSADQRGGPGKLPGLNACQDGTF
jgi:hypothetical protein